MPPHLRDLRHLRMNFGFQFQPFSLVPTPDPDEPLPPLPDTPEARRARKWLFRSLFLLVLINVGLLTWVLLTGWIKSSAP